jgi:hypothetical protein
MGIVEVPDGEGKILGHLFKEINKSFSNLEKQMITKSRE